VKKKQSQEPFVQLFPGFHPRPRTLLYLWGAYTVLLAVVAFTQHRIGDYAVETDFYWIYAPHAQALLHGQLLIDQFRGPGYEIILAGAGWLAGDMFRAGMLLSIVSAALTLMLVYRMIEKLFDAESALLVAAALALNHTFVIAAYTAATDMAFNLLAVLVLYLILRSTEGSRRDVVMAGLVAGFAYVSRYNAIAFFLAVPVGILLLNVMTTGWKQRLLNTALFIGASLVCILPWMLYTWRTLGIWSYNNNFYNIAYEMYAKGTMAWDDYWGKLAPQFTSYRDVIVYDPGRFFGGIAANAVGHLWSDMTLLVVVPLGLCAAGGMLAFLRVRTSPRQTFFFVYAAAYYLVLLPVFYGERFSLFLAPVFLLLAVSFFRWRVVPGGTGWKRLVLLGAIAYGGIAMVQRVSAEIGSGPTEILDVRDAYVRHYGHDTTGAKVAARKPHIAYYLNMEFVPFPYVDTLPRLLEELQKSSVTYLYYSPVEAGMRPQFQYLLDPRRAPPGLVPVLAVDRPPAVLYKVSH
jgi:4-amino-4-deoxy-L-arabinose transferase-like glycosyltransferase